MRIFWVSIFLFILSVFFIIIMDLLIGISLSASWLNIYSTFLVMTRGELIVLFLAIFYGLTRPIVSHFIDKQS